MRRPLQCACAALLLTACGCSAPADNGTAPAARDDQGAAHATSSPASAPESTMRGEVSALSADVSGLNVRVTDTATIVDLPADTLFAFDSAELGPGAEGNLGKAADLIRRGGAGVVRVVGHSDAKGTVAYNTPLSQRRARAVADWLKDQVGVRQRSFAVSGVGAAEPVLPDTRPDGSDDPAARARNRRVEIIVPR